MKKETEKDYTSPSTTIIYIRCLSLFAASGEAVESVAPEDWTEGNTDWWNS